MRFTYREKFSDNMGLIDDIDQSSDDDDEVFVSSDDVAETLTSVSSSADSSTSSDEEEDRSPTTVIRCDAGSELCRVRLGRLLGSGGFGHVYAGQLETGDVRRRGRRVAVKLPRRRSSGGGTDVSSATESFLAESDLVSLRHRNLVGVLAAGWICERSTDDTEVDMVPVIVMEYAGRRNLQTVIDDPSQAIGLRRRLNYAYDVTSALSFIHRRRLVHLDVKPANVIVTDRDRCKLTDFGCSRRLDDEEVGAIRARPRRPGSPAFTGTLTYRAPELLRGAAVSPAADVYSLGVSLWQLRSRAAPYAGRRDPHAVVFAVVAYHDRPDTSPARRRRRRRRAPGPPPAVPDVARTPGRRYRNVFRACWSASPDARPTAAELERLFRAWRSELDVASSTSSLDTDVTDDV